MSPLWYVWGKVRYLELTSCTRKIRFIPPALKGYRGFYYILYSHTPTFTPLRFGLSYLILSQTLEYLTACIIVFSVQQWAAYLKCCLSSGHLKGPVVTQITRRWNIKYFIVIESLIVAT